jgi:NTP pyrophosphatase (non-canonical NTP hydrolase)
MTDRWILTVEDEGILTFPPDLMAKAGWAEGDVLSWGDNGDGSWTLTKKMLQCTMNEKIQETLDILQEECAEVVVAVSKISRFGIDNFKPGKPKTNREHLEEELGDMLAMIDILVEKNVVSLEHLEVAKTAKIEKLKQWSKIYE